MRSTTGVDAGAAGGRSCTSSFTVFGGLVIIASLNPAEFTSQTITRTVIFTLDRGFHLWMRRRAWSSPTPRRASSTSRGHHRHDHGVPLWEVRIHHGWPAWVAIVFVVFIVAPALRCVRRLVVDAPTGRHAARGPARRDHRPHVLPDGVGGHDLGRELAVAAAARVLRRQARHRHRRRRAHVAPLRHDRGGDPRGRVPAVAPVPQPHRGGDPHGGRQPRASRRSTACARGGCRRWRGRLGSSMAAIAGHPARTQRGVTGRRADALHRRQAFAAAIIGRLRSLPCRLRRRTGHRRDAELRAQLPPVGWTVGHRYRPRSPR